MTTLSEPFKRVKRKVRKCENPLFEKWLKEWRDEAAKNGTEMQYCFNRALKSLKKFPVKLSSGKECMMLENFGAKICNMLDDKLERYKAQHPDDSNLQETVNELPSEDISTLKNDNKIESNPRKRKSSEFSPKKKKKIYFDDEEGKKFDYVPTYRSGGYAILLALFEKTQSGNFEGSLMKNDLQKYAQEYCDSFFTRPVSGSHYTAWSSMSVLIKKKLVTKQGNPPKFCLSEKGVDLAIKLKLAMVSDSVPPTDIIPVPKSICKPSVSPVKNLKNEKIEKSKTKAASVIDKEKTAKSTASSVVVNKAQDFIRNEETETEHVSEPDETVFMLPGSFQIMLLVDTQERDDKFQQADNMTMKHLKSRNVNFEIRHLKVGDFIWIAKDKCSGQELVLPYIVERKRMDDLASSIKDGRFHEQKFRLKQSGVENLIYLVEKYGNENQRLGLPLPSLQQAISNTQIVDGFNVKVTNNHDHSMRYLDCMTTQLSNIFKNKTLMSCKKSNLSPVNLSDDLISLMTFKDFNKGSEKNKKFTVRGMLVKHLLQLNGVSVEKAKAIVQLYPTPRALIDALRYSNAEKSIADLTFGGLNRSIGPVTAKQLQMLYTSLDLR